MLQRFKDRCAQRPYLADFKVIGDDNNFNVFGYAKTHIINIARVNDLTHMMVDRNHIYQSDDGGETWHHHGDVRNAQELIENILTEYGLTVSEETAKNIARIIGRRALAFSWEGNDLWDAFSRTANYIMPEGMVIILFTATRILARGENYSYRQYELLLDPTPSPTLDDYINLLVAQRDELREQFPDLALMGFPLRTSLYHQMDRAHIPCGELNRLARALKINAAVNAALPQPIAEEIVPEI